MKREALISLIVSSITELQTRILDLENQLAESKEVKDAQDKTIEVCAFWRVCFVFGAILMHC